MKRIIAVLLSFSLLCGLTGCAAGMRDDPAADGWNGADTLYPYAVIAQPGLGEPFAFEQGALITTETQLHYLDFASGQLVPFCFRPNCRHDTEDCNAMLSNRIWSFVANKKLYFLDGASARAVYDEELENYVGEIDLYVSSLNGSDEKKVTSFRMDMSMNDGSLVPLPLMFSATTHLVLYGDSAFVFYRLRRNPYPEPKPGEPTIQNDPEDFYGHCYVMEIDLKTDKVVRTEILNTGYGPELTPVCAYGGGIYLWRLQWDEPTLPKTSGETVYFEGKVLSTDEYLDIIWERRTETYVRYDIVTGEMELRDDLYPDEYGGPRVEWDGKLRPKLMLRGAAGDWCVIIDENIEAYNMATGEVQTLYENIPEEIRNDFLKAPGVSQVGDGTLLMLSLSYLEEPARFLYDLETGESHELGKAYDEAGDEVMLPAICGQNGDYLYGIACYASGQVIGYGRFDVSDGYDKPKFEMMLPV